MNDILIDRQLFLRLVDQYLSAEIQILHLKPIQQNQLISVNLSIAQQQLVFDQLRNEFKKYDSSEDLAVAIVKLRSLLDRHQKA